MVGLGCQLSLEKELSKCGNNSERVCGFVSRETDETDNAHRRDILIESSTRQWCPDGKKPEKKKANGHIQLPSLPKFVHSCCCHRQQTLAPQEASGPSVRA